MAARMISSTFNPAPQEARSSSQPPKETSFDGPVLSIPPRMRRGLRQSLFASSGTKTTTFNSTPHKARTSSIFTGSTPCSSLTYFNSAPHVARTSSSAVTTLDVTEFTFQFYPASSEDFVRVCSGDIHEQVALSIPPRIKRGFRPFVPGSGVTIYYNFQFHPA